MDKIKTRQIKLQEMQIVMQERVKMKTLRLSIRVKCSLYRVVKAAKEVKKMSNREVRIKIKHQPPRLRTSRLITS